VKRYEHIKLGDLRTLEGAAVEMAHTLLELAGEGPADKYCNGCGDTDGRGHTPNCSLLALLRGAGFSGFKVQGEHALKVVR
jgi:hypothetical protein